MFRYNRQLKQLSPPAEVRLELGLLQWAQELLQQLVLDQTHVYAVLVPHTYYRRPRTSGRLSEESGDGIGRVKDIHARGTRQDGVPSCERRGRTGECAERRVLLQLIHVARFSEVRC